MNEVLERAVRVDASGAARFVKAARFVHRDTGVTSGAPLPARWPAMREAMLAGAVGVAGLLAATGPIEHAGDRISVADRLRSDAEVAAQARGWVPADTNPTGDPDADPDVAPPATVEK